MSSAVVTLSDDALLAAVTDLEVEQRRLVFRRHALIAEVESRGLARERGMRTTAGLLSRLLRISVVRRRRGCRRPRIWVRAAG